MFVFTAKSAVHKLYWVEGEMIRWHGAPQKRGLSVKGDSLPYQQEINSQNSSHINKRG